MSTLRTELLDHRDAAVAHKLHALLVRAHAQETQLLQGAHTAALERTVQDIQSSNEYVLGVLSGDELLGAVSVGPDDEPGQILVTLLIVHPDHQRQGMARSLMRAALSLGQDAAFAVVTTAANTPALALYEQLGFVPYRHGLLGPDQLPMVKLRRAGHP